MRQEWECWGKGKRKLKSSQIFSTILELSLKINQHHNQPVWRNNGQWTSLIVRTTKAWNKYHFLQFCLQYSYLGWSKSGMSGQRRMWKRPHREERATQISTAGSHGSSQNPDRNTTFDIWNGKLYQFWGTEKSSIVVFVGFFLSRNNVYHTMDMWYGCFG